MDVAMPGNLCIRPPLMSLTEPRLPVELERKVFELAAHSRPKSIPTLLLVAHRVKIW